MPKQKTDVAEHLGVPVAGRRARLLAGLLDGLAGYTGEGDRP